MKREPTPTAGELAEGLRRPCVAWRKLSPRGSCFPPCGRGTGRNSWPWRPGGWWRKGKIAQEKTRDNSTKTREFKSLRRLNKKDAPKVLTGQNPCGIMGKLPKPGDSFC